MKQFHGIVLAVLVLCLDGNIAHAEVHEQEVLGSDGFPTGLIRDHNGVLRTKGDKLVAKFSCSPQESFRPNEVSAADMGAPACPDGYEPTLWLCIPNEAINPGERGLDLTREGQPSCGPHCTAVRQPLSPNTDAVKASPFTHSSR
jgi:hypothetical protein